ncbi:MAG: hypothetical protein MJB57_09320 [Gemmatimonadetes bacterium]|nr:hypothetical protein [Gemmatimonadota bacterium]
MKKSMGICLVSGMLLVGCGEGNSPLDPETSLLSESEELMSQALVDEAEALTGEADVADVRVPTASDAFPVDIRETDRLCRISDRTIVQAEELTVAAKNLYDHIHTNYPRSASDGQAAEFARASSSFTELLVEGSTCRRIVVAFIGMAKQGHELARTLRREHLIRKDDRIGALVRKARAAFEDLIKTLRHDISGQASDVRRARDAAGADDRADGS